MHTSYRKDHKGPKRGNKEKLHLNTPQRNIGYIFLKERKL